jgi:patatin-like phospholipase/acyl hydrolase
MTIDKKPTFKVVLTCFSGGVRALVELVILRLIEDRTGFNIPIQEFFDLIVGTR